MAARCTRMALLLILPFVGVVAILLFAHLDEAYASHTYLRFPWELNQRGYITQGYAQGTHTGGNYYALDIDIEFAGTLGTVVAAATGTVVTAVANQQCSSSGYGNYVDIRSTTPAGETRYARYAHLSAVNAYVGQLKYKSFSVGIEGNSGYTINCGPQTVLG